MSQRVEVDAVSSNFFDYRSALLVIYNQLRSSEVQAMKFLCSDFISIAKMERIQNALDLFQELEKLQRIGEPDNVHLLAELLYHVGRADQLRTLRLTKETVARAIQENSVLDRFRVMLFKLSEQLTTKDTKELLFIYGKDLPRPKKESIEKPEELFQALEKHCVLTRNNPTCILDMMDSIGRSDLRHLVREHFGSRAGRMPQMPNHSVAGETIRLQSDFDRPLNIGATQDLSRTVAESARNKLIKDNQYAIWNDPQKSYSSKVCQPVTESDSAIFRQYSQGSRGMAEPSLGGTGLFRTQSCEDNNAVSQRSAFVQLVEDDQLELPCYPMTRKPRGICLIINNEKFYKDPSDSASRKMPDREGTQKDAKLLQDLFSEKLKFQTMTHHDLTANEIKDKLLAAARKVDHSSYDCFVCCILSHGILGSIYGVDGRTVEIKDLTNFFKGASCKSLQGKPKIFFIQACQGKDKQIGYPVATDDGLGPMSVPQQDGLEAEELPVETIPNEADFLIGYATVPGYVSFRSKSQGSWYINTLVKMLHKYGSRYDLLSIMIKVNEEVSRAIAAMNDGSYKQSPMPMATLRKRIFFQ